MVTYYLFDLLDDRGVHISISGNAYDLKDWVDQVVRIYLKNKIKDGDYLKLNADHEYQWLWVNNTIGCEVD